MTVEMCAGIWKRRDGTAMTVRLNDGSRWVSVDGYHYWDDGRFIQGQEHKLDLIEFLGEIPEPQSQPDAADKLAELREDRDRWQTRARQAEGRVATLTQELTAVTANRDGLGRRIHETENDRDKWRGRVTEATGRVAELEQQVSDLQAQLEAAVHAPDLRGDLERVAAERDAAREEVRGLQVRVQQAEGDARQANGKLGHLEGEVTRWKAQVTVKNDSLLRAEAGNDVLQVVILNLFREVRGGE